MISNYCRLLLGTVVAVSACSDKEGGDTDDGTGVGSTGTATGTGTGMGESGKPPPPPPDPPPCVPLGEPCEFVTDCCAPQSGDQVECDSDDEGRLVCVEITG